VHLPRLFKTVSFKLAAFYAAAFGISVLILGAVVYITASNAFDDQTKARILAESSALNDLYKSNGLAAVRKTIETRQGHRLFLGLEYGLFDAHGKLIYGTVPPTLPKPGWSDVSGPPDGDEPPGEDEHMTVYTTPLTSGETLVVGDDLQGREEFDEAILRTFALGLLLSITLAAIGGAIVSAVFLRRVDTITRAAETIIQGDIGHRIALRGTGDDLDNLSATLNRMLDRISTLMEAMRQVTNDIAHDLRTPIGRLRQSLDEARRSPATETELRGAMEHAIGQTDSILDTFAALLRIAQIEAGSRKAGFTDINVSELAEGIAQTFAPAADDAGKTLRSNIAKDVHGRGDPELLTQLIVNLIENGLTHTPAGAVITLGVEQVDRGAVITVADNGPGIAASDRDRVFRRFYRLDQSRGTGGSGLGLSLVAAIAELHDAKLTLSDNAPGLCVRVALPPPRQTS
jgi:signal transduction histidine kinase